MVSAFHRIARSLANQRNALDIAGSYLRRSTFQSFHSGLKLVITFIARFGRESSKMRGICFRTQQLLTTVRIQAGEADVLVRNVSPSLFNVKLGRFKNRLK